VVVINEVSGGGVGSLGIGLSFGLAVTAAIYSVGHISGAHINPAVTLAFALTRHFPWTLVPAYMISQLLGACAASAVHLALFGDVANLGAPVRHGSEGGSPGVASHPLPDVRYLIGRHRRPSRRAGRRDSHRRLCGPRRHLRRSHSRSVDEPSALLRPHPVERYLDPLVGLLGRTHSRGRTRCPNLSLRAGGESTQAQLRRTPSRNRLKRGSEVLAR
jgi:hypothetical protein